MTPEPASSSRHDGDISDEASARICKHMNIDHAVTVHAMAIESLPWKERGIHIDNAQMKSVSLGGYNLTFVLCNGDQCEMRSPAVSFSPPLLTSADQVKKRLIEIHHSVLSPKMYWLVTDPMALAILVVCFGLGYATYVIGEDNLASHVEIILS